MTEDKNLQYTTQAYAIAATEMKGGKHKMKSSTSPSSTNITDNKKDLDGSTLFNVPSEQDE